MNSRSEREMARQLRRVDPSDDITTQRLKLRLELALAHIESSATSARRSQ